MRKAIALVLISLVVGWGVLYVKRRPVPPPVDHSVAEIDAEVNTPSVVSIDGGNDIWYISSGSGNWTTWIDGTSTGSTYSRMSNSAELDQLRRDNEQLKQQVLNLQIEAHTERYLRHLAEARVVDYWRRFGEVGPETIVK
jgi:hypothetical protein